MVDAKTLKLFRENLTELGEYLTRLLVAELEEQGHRATGNLIKSVEWSVQNFLFGLELQISYKKYGVYVDQGVKASEIKSPFAPARIKALTDWVLLKRLTSGLDKAKGIAYAIARTHAKYGIPSPGSYEHSKNGRRTGFQTFTLEQNFQKIIQHVTEGIERVINIQIESAVSNLQEDFIINI